MDANIEVGVWHNGRPVGPLFSHTVYGLERQDWEHSFTIPMHVNHALSVQVRTRFSGEIMEDWISGEMWLFDETNCPISTPKPFMLYVGQSDCPSVTMFPASADRLPNMGMWAVSLRMATDLNSLRKHFQANIGKTPYNQGDTIILGTGPS